MVSFASAALAAAAEAPPTLESMALICNGNGTGDRVERSRACAMQSDCLVAMRLQARVVRREPLGLNAQTCVTRHDWRDMARRE